VGSRSFISRASPAFRFLLILKMQQRSVAIAMAATGIHTAATIWPVVIGWEESCPLELADGKTDRGVAVEKNDASVGTANGSSGKLSEVLTATGGCDHTGSPVIKGTCCNVTE